MAFIPFIDGVRVIIEFSIAGVLVTITLSGVKPGGFDIGDQGDLADSIETWASDILVPDLSVNAALTKVTVYDMRTSTSPVVTNVVSPAEAGGINEVSIDIGSAMVASFRTEARGRSGRGRNFVPGVPSTTRTNPTSFNATIQTTMTANYGTLDNAFSDVGFVWTVASTQQDGVVLTTANNRAVTAVILDAPVGNQRGRGLFT